MAEVPLPPSRADITTLFGLLAEAFALSAEDLAHSLETGAMTLTPGQDPDGRRWVRASLGEPGSKTRPRRIRVYRDALLHEDAPPAPTKDGSS